MDGLYLGNYYVKEITPPTGYLADEEEHDLVCNYEGDLVAEVKRDCLSLEQVMKPKTLKDKISELIKYTGRDPNK